MPLFHLGGASPPTCREDTVGPGAPRMQGWKGLWSRALGLSSGGDGGGGWRERGCRGRGCGVALWAWLFGKGIVLVLLTKPQPTCRAWLGICNCPGWRGRPFPTRLTIPACPHALLGGGKPQSSCIEPAICQPQSMQYLNTGSSLQLSYETSS